MEDIGEDTTMMQVDNDNIENNNSMPDESQPPLTMAVDNYNEPAGGECEIDNIEEHTKGVEDIKNIDHIEAVNHIEDDSDNDDGSLINKESNNKFRQLRKKPSKLE